MKIIRLKASKLRQLPAGLKAAASRLLQAKWSKRRILFAVVLLVLVVGLTAGTIYKISKRELSSSAECAVLLEDAKRLSSDKKSQEAYERLKGPSEKCGNQDEALAQFKGEEKSAETYKRITYNAELARAAYQAGDKASAKQHASKVLEIHKKLSPAEVSAFPNADALFFEMVSIQNDIPLVSNGGVAR